MAAHPDEQAGGRVHDVARFGVVAAPGGLEAHALQLRNPLGEDFGGDFQEGLRIDLQVLAGLGRVRGGGGAADDLAGGGKLLAVHGGEALVVATVDEHVQRVSVLADERQPLGDEGLVADREEAGVQAQHPGELLRAGAEGVHEDGRLEPAVATVGRLDGHQEGLPVFRHVDEFRILHDLTAQPGR